MDVEYDGYVAALGDPDPPPEELPEAWTRRRSGRVDRPRDVEDVDSYQEAERQSKSPVRPGG